MSERHTILERDGFWAGTEKSTQWDLWYGLIEVDGGAVWGTSYFGSQGLAEDSVRKHLSTLVPEDCPQCGEPLTDHMWFGRVVDNPEVWHRHMGRDARPSDA